MSSRKAQLRARRLGRILKVSLAAAALLTPAIAPAQVTTPPAVTMTATAPRTLSLDEAVRMAESQSEAVRIARAGVQRAEGQQYQARSNHGAPYIPMCLKAGATG